MNRKPRKDSKLHNLPAEQRARVDKWLFDKGLTYEQVAEGCLKMFGLKLSKSSVGRYYERQSRQRVELAQSQRRGRIFRQRLINTGLQPGEQPRDYTAAASAAFCLSEKPLKRLPPSSAGSTGLKPGVNESEPTPLSLEAGFQELLAAITKRATDLATYLQLEWDAEASRELLRLVRVLIAARRERTLGLLAQSERRGFRLWAAKECLRIGRERSTTNPAVAGRRRIQRPTSNGRKETETSNFEQQVRWQADNLIAAEAIRHGIPPRSPQVHRIAPMPAISNATCPTRDCAQRRNGASYSQIST